MPIAK